VFPSLWSAVLRRTPEEIGEEELHSVLYALSIASLIVCVACAAAIAIHIAMGHGQQMWIMNVVWPLTALYFGPVALWYYFAYGRLPREKRHHLAFWHKVALGTTHCGAGCALGDFIGEWMVFAGGLSIAHSVLLANYAVDFGFAYGVGVMFQYYAIAPMRGIHGWPGIKAAMKADTVSLVAFEVGMFAFMAISHRAFVPPLMPDSPIYWFMMQVAMGIGFATSFPANWWLIRRGWKEEM
jgi:hypothetical protein